MRFEEALVIELSSVTGLSNKVFPLVATEGTNAPYVVYSSSEGIFDKSLDGYDNYGKEIDLDINVVSSSYSDLKNVTTLVTDKLISFIRREIGGTGGVMVYDLEIRTQPLEFYDSNTRQYKSLISIGVRV